MESVSTVCERAAKALRKGAGKLKESKQPNMEKLGRVLRDLLLVTEAMSAGATALNPKAFHRLSKIASLFPKGENRSAFLKGMAEGAEMSQQVYEVYSRIAGYLYANPQKAAEGVVWYRKKLGTVVNCLADVIEAAGTHERIDIVEELHSQGIVLDSFFGKPLPQEGDDEDFDDEDEDEDEEG